MVTNIEKLIYKEIYTLLPEYIDFLSQLVKIDSTYGKERNAQLFVKSKMEALGLDVRVYYSRADDESMNLVSVIKGRNEGKSLILNAHCDVAAVDDPRRWLKDPFSGEIEGNILHGRGSQDDKAGICIILMIVNVLKNLGIELDGDLIVQSVIEDETTGNGSKVLVDNGYSADGVIIVDGTWSERIIYAHLGQIWLDFKIIGEPVAACVEGRGINPIYIACKLIQGLRDFINFLNQTSVPFESIDKPYFLNIGSLHSGVWHGSVPSEANIQVQIGFPDKMMPEDMIERVKDIANKVSNRIIVSENLLKTPAFRVNSSNILLQKLRAIIERNADKEVKTVAVTGHCDMRHFNTQNICLYGPGGGKNAHGIDEYYMLDQMPLVAKNILDLVIEWCSA